MILLPEARFRTLLAHIKTVEENLPILINLQQSRESREDVLPAPVSNLEELDDLCTKVTDTTLTKKLVRISCIILVIIFLEILNTIWMHEYFV